MEALEQLMAVTCDPEGNASISGSYGDLCELQQAITALRAWVAEQSTEIATQDESLIKVEAALEDVDYRGTYADGILALKGTIQRQAALIEQCRQKFDQLAKLGNGERFGNSTGNLMAHAALAAIDAAIGDDTHHCGQDAKEAQL